ncbi:MAG: hypothetical protein ACP5GU_03155 [Thermoprotei archaeon]|jgi:hypothetical protein
MNTDKFMKIFFIFKNNTVNNIINNYLIGPVPLTKHGNFIFRDVFSSSGGVIKYSYWNSEVKLTYQDVF